MALRHSADLVQYVALYGDHKDGFLAIGPFEDKTDAQRYVDEDPEGAGGIVAEIYPPG